MARIAAPANKKQKKKRAPEMKTTSEVKKKNQTNEPLYSSLSTEKSKLSANTSQEGSEEEEATEESSAAGSEDSSQSSKNTSIDAESLPDIKSYDKWTQERRENDDAWNYHSAQFISTQPTHRRVVVKKKLCRRLAFPLLGRSYTKCAREVFKRQLVPWQLSE